MKAVVITKAGGPEVLEIREVSDPAPGAGQLLIDIRATALNRADLLQRQGHYPPPADAPPYPGLECAGTINALGESVTGWTVGQRVMALLGGGGYAEKVVVPQESVLPIPEGLSWAEAAAIPEAWLTAYSNMIEIGRLQSGERVLIHAGASGVGSAAIQLAKWRGATVFSTVSQQKVEGVRALGADVVIDYKQENFAERVLEESDGQGVDLILDFIGAPYWDDNLRALALWGRLVLVGLMGGREVKANLGLFLSKKLSVHGSTLRDRTLEQKQRLVAAFTREVLPAFASGQLRPILDERQFTLNEVAEAHRYMEANQNFGKVILLI
ncbi:MAG: NAD(P)H-quinone oxidoreductase [Ardenticatenales bacterium]|nr:NAD(P)H-quinone oxidoreductase [Ardenticatenales bacterium]